MTAITRFCFNPFQENTYILSASDGECWIIDPGCYSEQERQQLSEFITNNNLRPSRLINTHCHLDHIFGNAWVMEQYHTGLEIHQDELPVLQAAPQIGKMFGVNTPPQPLPTAYLREGQVLSLGDAEMEVLFTPGHSPGEICLLCRQERFVIVADVLFQGSIGRTDLPGGDYTTLLQSIRTQLLVLDDDYKVYCGHGPETTIGEERRNNPFLA
jgi:glyoxylase-like metal-dependent hydrolase (beta-lactamase superfamily II)